MENILEIILIVISILLITLVLLQSNKASDAGQIVAGNTEALFGKVKERGSQLFITRLTLILGLLFFGISLALFLM